MKPFWNDQSGCPKMTHAKDTDLDEMDHLADRKIARAKEPNQLI
jgi:hypothetical protein